MAAPTQKPIPFIRIERNGVHRVMLVNPFTEDSQDDQADLIDRLRVYHSPHQAEPFSASLADLSIPFVAKAGILELTFTPGVLGIFAFSFVAKTGEEGPISNVAPFVYGRASNLEATIASQSACVTDPTPIQILEALDDASRQFDMYTDQWFYPRYLSKQCDGEGANDLLFGVAIIHVIEMFTTGGLTIRSSNNVLVDAERYTVYNRHILSRKAFDPAFPRRPDGFIEFPGDGTGGQTNPDDREAPKISFLHPNEIRKGHRAIRRNEFSRHGFAHRLSHEHRGFPRGRQNVLVKGFFGYTETDIGTPVGVQLGTERLALRDVVIRLGDSSEVERVLRGHNVVMEKTDTHFVMYRSKDPLQGAFTGEPQIDQFIARYVRPPEIGAV